MIFIFVFNSFQEKKIIIFFSLKIKGIEMGEKRPRIEIDNSKDAFWTDFITITHIPNQIAIDFRQTTPRFNPGPGEENQQTLVIKHNVILMSPVLAKSFLEILKKNLEEYEKRFGKIKVPKPKKGKKVQTTTTPGYVG